MRAVVQRVKKSRVVIENQENSKIENGLMVLLGVTHEDKKEDVDYLLEKIINLRVFEDEDGKLNKSLLDVKGNLMVVSQFTLYGDCRKGRRPNFMQAAKPEIAVPLYESFLKKAKEHPINVESGVFGADMQIELINDGPVTLILDSQKNF